MSSHRVTPGQFADELRRLADSIPAAVERAMVDGGMMLQGRLIQREIAASTPHQPVDQGQYKASFQLTEVEGGCVVGSSAKHAVWIERGRAPGPVPLAPIIEWVKRKGIARKSLKAKRQAATAARKAKSPPLARPSAPGAPRTPPGPKAPKPPGDKDSRFGAMMKRAQKRAATAAAIDEEAKGIALGITRKIRTRGIAPRRVLRRAITALGPLMPKIIRRALMELQP